MLTNKDMKRCSASLVIRKRQIKITMICLPIEVAEIQKTRPNIGGVMERPNLPCIVHGNVKCDHSGNFLKCYRQTGPVAQPFLSDELP